MEKMGGAGLQECHRRSSISNSINQSIRVSGIARHMVTVSILMKDHFMGTAIIV